MMARRRAWSKAILVAMVSSMIALCHTQDNLPPADLLEPPDSGPGDSYLAFPPPDYNFEDYTRPPASEEPQWPPTSPPNPPTAKSPPSPPQSPSPPPAPPSPGPKERPPMRMLVGGNGAEGVVQVWDGAASKWGAFCVPRQEFTQYEYSEYEPDQDLAKLICQELGMPTYAAVLLPPWQFLSTEESLRMPAKVLGFETNDMCDNALEAASPFDCQGVMTLPTLARSCMEAGRANDPWGPVRRNFVPVAVSCRGHAPPPRLRQSPPPPVAAPPPGFGPPAVNYTMRITAIKSGLEVHPNGSRVTRGRLEVLLTPPGQSEPVWGTVCRSYPFAPEVAQYACKSQGLPWRTATILYDATPTYFASLKAKPIHIVAMQDCEIRPDGLACGVVANFTDARDALKRGGLSDELRLSYRHALELCDTEDGKGHGVDAFVVCSENTPPPPNPSPPPPPQPPPSPPLAVRNDVQVNFTPYFDSAYGVSFGVRAPSSGELVWGGLCAATGGADADAAAALCHQATGGRRPFGTSKYLGIWDYSFLPAYAVRQNTPVVLSGLDCSRVPGGPPPNVTLCEAVLASPLPQHPSPGCQLMSWSNQLLFCHEHRFYSAPEVLSVRLVGGADRSMGRLEVVTQSRLASGWGTVCGLSFNVTHAQAVCRDLGLPWSRAAVLPATAVPEPAAADQPIVIDNVGCSLNDPDHLPWLRNHTSSPPLSFIRDCADYWHGAKLPHCGHESDVVIKCEGEDGPGPDVAPSPPTPATACGTHGGYGGYAGYGGYGYGCYGAYGGGAPPPENPPSYGGYGGYGAYGYGEYGWMDGSGKGQDSWQIS